MKPYFPKNWSHSLADRKSRGDMEEGTSAQPFEAHWDGLVALISSSIFESDGFVIPEIISQSSTAAGELCLQSKLCL